MTDEAAIERVLLAYERARSIVGGGPLLRVFPGPKTSLPSGADRLIEAVFARAIERCRYPPRGREPQVAVRLDAEQAVTGSTSTVVRIFDTGPVADRVDIAPLGAFAGRAEIRREPPSGPWTGVVALRFIGG